MATSTSSGPWLSAAGRLGEFAWSVWIGLAGVAVIAALWQLGHEAFGDFILPAPLDVAVTTIGLLQQPDTWRTALQTGVRSVQGLALALGVGSLLGVLAGYSPALMRLARPILTVLLGVPPIAWIVIVMIWFGSSDATVVLTVAVAAGPLLFVGAAEGVATRDRRLDEMARAFGAGPFIRWVSLGLRQMLSSLFPALTMATGTAFKVAVMAELLTNTGGVGTALADARALLDMRQALAWVTLTVALLLIVEFGVIHPVRSHLERWRDAGRAWGVRW